MLVGAGDVLLLCMKAVVRPRWRLFWITPTQQQAGTVVAPVHCQQIRLCAGARPRTRRLGRRQGGQCGATVTVAEPIVQSSDRQHASIESMSVQDILQSLRQNCMFDVASGSEVLPQAHCPSPSLETPPPPPAPALRPFLRPHPSQCAFSRSDLRSPCAGRLCCKGMAATRAWTWRGCSARVRMAHFMISLPAKS